MELETRDKLLESAKKLFAQKGYDGVSVKEICDGARVNISSVSYHFEGKEGLYQHVLEQFGRRRLESARQSLQPARDLSEFRLRLEMFASEFLRASAEESELALIVHREMALGSGRANEILKNSFLPTLACLVQYFESAKQAKLLNPEFVPEASATLYWGSLIHLVMSDHFRKTISGVGICDESFRRLMADHLSRAYVHGIAVSSIPVSEPSSSLRRK